MNELEKALKTALHRQPAPERFADRVLTKVRLGRAPVLSWWQLSVVRWSVATVVLALLAGAVTVHQRRQRIRGEQAREQVLLALRITGTKLRAVRREIVKTNDEGGNGR